MGGRARPAFAGQGGAVPADAPEGVPMRVVSVQVGRVHPVAGPGAPLLSAIDKRPVVGPVRVGRDGIDGDEVGHPRSHGGPERALLFVTAATLSAWSARLGRSLAPGAFGENVTIDGLDDAAVRIGDVFRWGAVELEVSSARMPCDTLARHLRAPGAVEALSSPHRAGWYVRVRTPGLVAATDRIEVVARGDPAWTVERAAHVYANKADVEGARALLAAPGLSGPWRERLGQRIAAAEPGGR